MREGKTVQNYLKTALLVRAYHAEFRIIGTSFRRQEEILRAIKDLVKEFEFQDSIRFKHQGVESYFENLVYLLEKSALDMA